MKNVKILGALVLASASNTNSKFVYDVSAGFGAGRAWVKKNGNYSADWLYQGALSAGIGFGNDKLDCQMAFFQPSIGSHTGFVPELRFRYNVKRYFLSFDIGCGTFVVGISDVLAQLGGLLNFTGASTFGFYFNERAYGFVKVQGGYGIGKFGRVVLGAGYTNKQCLAKI